MYPKVSVIIIAKNEPRIRHTLRSLMSQTVKAYEVLVVVDEPNDVSAEIATNTSELPIKIVHNDIPGYGGARKTGVEQASGDIVAFIDADCIADKDWIKNLVEMFSKSNVIVQAGKVVGIKSLDEVSTVSKQPNTESPSFLRFAPTLNFAFKKQLVNVIGNFDPKFKEGGEDLDFCVRLRKAGYRILYNPDAKVYHLKHKYNLQTTWRDGKSRARVFIKHGTAMLSDAFICFFHSISLLVFVILLVIGYPKLALLTFTPSLLHRLYRAAINVKQGSGIFIGLLGSFITYASHIAFVTEFAISLVGLALQRRKH